MPPFIALLLTTNIVIFGFLLLHYLSKKLGLGSFYGFTIIIVLFFLVSHSLNLEIIHSEHHLNIASIVFLAPLIAILLVTYYLEGDLATQQLSLSIIVSLFFMITFYFLFIHTFKTENFIITFTPSEQLTNKILQHRSESIASLLISFLLNLIFLPVIFQFLQNRQIGLFLSLLFSCLLSQLIDTTCYVIILNFWDNNFSISTIRNIYFGRTISLLWACLICWLYVYLFHRKKITHTNRSPFTYLSSLFYDNNARANFNEWAGRFEMFIKNLQELVIIINKDKKIIDLNHIAEKTLQLHYNKIINRPLFHFLDPPYPNSTEFNQNNDAIQQLFFKNIDENNKIWNCSINSFNNKNQQLTLIIGRNYSQQHKFNQQKQILQKQVAKIDKIQAVERLGGGVAHDFNNTLHTVYGHLDLLKKTPKKHQKKILDNIYLTLNKTINLIKQLLDFTGNKEIIASKTNLASIINEVYQLSLPLVGKNINMIKIIAPELMWINVNKSNIEQLLINLIINAKDALKNTKDAKITIIAQPIINQTILGWSNAPKDSKISDYYLIKINDNGHGIPPEISDKIFEPFFTTKEIGKGNGMGLAMVASCLKQHKGWLHSTSIPNKKTEFYIYLPAYKN